MDKRETVIIMKVLQTAYPQSFKGWGKEQAEMFVSLWQEAFSSIPAQIVTKAVKNIVYTSERDFAPNIGQVRAEITRMAQRNSLGGQQAWSEVKGYLHHCDSNYPSDETNKVLYDRLPEEVRAMYSMTELLSLAKRNSMDNDQFEKPRFLKDYAGVQASLIEKKFENGDFTAIGMNTNVKAIEEEAQR